MSAGPDWSALRTQFPALREWVCLDTASFGQTPESAERAIAEHMARRARTASADFLQWFDDADAIRANVGKLVGCGADDIAFLPTAAAALSLLMGGIRWCPGDRIVTLLDEFPNNLYYPALIEGVEFVETDWEGFWDAVTPNTRLVVVSGVNYVNGFRAPIGEMARGLRERGILFYIDGTQSVGALRIDVGALQPAMLAVDAYKWMLTPNGAGFVYVRPDVREWLRPNCIGWRSHFDWRSVANLHHGAPEFSPKAEKYEGGMIPFAMLYAMNAVVEMMLAAGPEEIERRVLALAADLRGRLERLGGEVAHTGSQIVAARFEGQDARELARELRTQRVLVSARHGNLRVSVHFYNNEEDLDRLEAALKGSLARYNGSSE